MVIDQVYGYPKLLESFSIPAKIKELKNVRKVYKTLSMTV